MSIETEVMEPQTKLIERKPISKPAPPPTPRPSMAWRILRGLLLYLLPVVVIVAGIFGARRLIETAPKAERRPPERQATPVTVKTFNRTAERAIIRVMGTVLPAQQIALQPRVGGEVVKLSPRLMPGGRFQAGEFVLQIDPQDYELAVRETQSQTAQAEYDQKIEQGYQEVAEREWKLLGMQDKASELDQELALRKPHLLRIGASLEAAKAAVRSAELALERTTVQAPFNCMVTAENVDLGAQVTPQTQLAMLVGTDEYWVQAAVPVEQLEWIVFPDGEGGGGSKATVRQKLGTGLHGEWIGRVVRLLGNLEPQGRMARVLVSVPDPLHLNDPDGGKLPLLIDAYVNVAITGKPVENAISVPRTALRQGREIWVMNENDQLEIREIDIVWSNDETVLVRSGIDEGEQVVMTDLSAPVAGMALRRIDDRPGATSSAADPD